MADPAPAVEAAVEAGILSRERRIPLRTLPTPKLLLASGGKDIVKKSMARKGRYLLNIAAALRPTAAGKMGTLAKLDTDSPVLYLDFPCGGRLKFEGSLVFPKAKYAVMRVGAKEVLCEDVLENMVCFSKAIWIGTAAENPQEKELPMPEGVLVATLDGGGSKAKKKGVTEEWFGDCVGLGAPLGGGLGALPPAAAAAAAANSPLSSSAPATDDEGVPAGDSQRNAGGRMRRAAAAKKIDYGAEVVWDLDSEPGSDDGGVGGVRGRNANNGGSSAEPEVRLPRAPGAAQPPPGLSRFGLASQSQQQQQAPPRRPPAAAAAAAAAALKRAKPAIEEEGAEEEEEVLVVSDNDDDDDDESDGVPAATVSKKKKKKKKPSRPAAKAPPKKKAKKTKKKAAGSSDDEDDDDSGDDDDDDDDDEGASPSGSGDEDASPRPARPARARRASAVAARKRFAESDGEEDEEGESAEEADDEEEESSEEDDGSDFEG